MELISNSTPRHFEASLFVLIKWERLWNESTVLTRCCCGDVICLLLHGKCVMSFHFAHLALPLTAHSQVPRSSLTFKSLTVTTQITKFNIQNCYVLRSECIQLSAFYISQNKEQTLPYTTLSDGIL